MHCPDLDGRALTFTLSKMSHLEKASGDRGGEVKKEEEGWACPEMPWYKVSHLQQLYNKTMIASNII